MDRLVSVDTKELLFHYTQQCQDRHSRRHPSRKLGAKPSDSSPAQQRRRRRSPGCCSGDLRVTNLMHTMPIAVHLSTTRPSSFHISPSSALAVLHPLSSCSFSLHYLAPSPSPDGDDGASSSSPPLVSPPDTVLVRSALLPTGKADAAHLLQLFSGPPVPQIFTDARIPISFVGPIALLSLLRLSSRSPSSSSSSSAPLTLDTAFLLSKAASGCSPSDLSSILLQAADAGNPRFVSALLDAGAEPNHRDGAGRSALSLAVAAGSVETVEALLDSGALVDTALDRLVVHEAAAENRVDLMEAVGCARTEEEEEEREEGKAWWAESLDSAGRTPLHVAAAHGHLEAARFCLSRCDPDRGDAQGWTPLHHAAAGGFLEVARLLLERCSYATKYVLTADGRKTPFDLAVDAQENARLLDLLRLGDLLHRAAAVGDAGGVRSCLGRGAAVDGRDQNGWTALHRAAFKGRVEVAGVLIEHGAELDAADGEGWTPLRCAAEAGQTEVALLLVASGAARTGLKGLAARAGLGCRRPSAEAEPDAPPPCATAIFPTLCREGESLADRALPAV